MMGGREKGGEGEKERGGEGEKEKGKGLSRELASPISQCGASGASSMAILWHRLEAAYPLTL